MFVKEELEEIQKVIYWAICEGYLIDEINPELKSVVDKLGFSREDLEEMKDISGKNVQ